ncbi:MAG: class I SAM-dependent methyltransferase [Anaerolineales bacterium]|nr:class I SAM-dependent methyltransferase [Anaerolineales bacterium]
MYLYRLSLEDRVAERERLYEEITHRDKIFIETVIRERFSLDPQTRPSVLDFGCGRGNMVRHMHSLGYDAWGCDISPAWEGRTESPVERLRLIDQEPYRLPFDDDTFDLVFSTSVLEHARNTEELFSEIRRILKPGGISMHFFPGKWYLPYEPHVRIPLLNYFWPRCPRWWINLWLIVRGIYSPQVRPYRQGILERYCEFCKYDIVYWPNRTYRRLSMKIFGNFGSLTDFYIARAGGGYARLARKLPFKRLSAWFTATFRMNFIYQRKEG